MTSAKVRKSFLFYLLPIKSTPLLREPHVPFSLCLHFFSSCSIEHDQIAKPVAFKHPPSKIPKTTKSITLFLKDNGFSDTQIDRVLKKGREMHLVNIAKTIKPKFKVFHEFGFSRSEIADIISKQPKILEYSAIRRIHPSLSMLHNLFDSHDVIVKVLLKTEWFISTDLKKNLYPNIEFLKSCGTDMERILRLLILFPRALLCPPKSITKIVEKIYSLGVDSKSKMFIYCLWVGASMNNKVWESKLQTFRDLGFTESEIISTFKSAPQVFTISPDKIKRVTELILDTDRYTISSIKSYPLLLCRSLDNRLKPRLRILKILEKMKVIKKWPSLSPIYRYTDKRFHDNFIAPYPELKSILLAKEEKRKTSL